MSTNKSDHNKAAQSVKFDLQNLDKNGPTEEEHQYSPSIADKFDKKYNEYLERVKEVNKAKDMLRVNRDKMSNEAKAKFVKHIRRKMKIVEMIEEELKVDG